MWGGCVSSVMSAAVNVYSAAYVRTANNNRFCCSRHKQVTVKDTDCPHWCFHSLLQSFQQHCKYRRISNFYWQQAHFLKPCLSIILITLGRFKRIRLVLIQYTHTHTHTLALRVRTLIDIMHSLASSPDLTLNLTLTLKPGLNPQTALWSCEDWPKCPHKAEMSSRRWFKARSTQRQQYKRKHTQSQGATLDVVSCIRWLLVMWQKSSPMV